jgi:ribosomal protein S18 acetylase RimI-like enzyme
MIRRAAPAEAQFITEVGAQVYAALGDYSRILPSWLAHPGVLAYVEADDGAIDVPRGFILLGFYNGLWIDDAPPPTGELVADLLAIGVAPDHQRRGIGSTLLAFALDFVSHAAGHAPIREMRLTVADTNTGAQKLFRANGFVVLDEHHGAYDGGQRAIRMRRPITPVPQSPA